MSEINNDEKYQIVKAKRRKFVDAILHTEALKKVVVAGPGTGKTFLFKSLLEDTPKSLTLTFVNSLVEDLSLELNGMSEVRTLHSYARSILSKISKKNIKISPYLSEIIQEDGEFLIGKKIDFEKMFHEFPADTELIDFYRKRRLYYDYYGYSDIIYALIRSFETIKDSVPLYDQVLVDEFQDFNKLEVALIDLLSEKSPILLAGDDDQALYGFKSASSCHIRERFNEGNPDYSSFTLPYCARCTRVVIDSTNDIIDSAKNLGFLAGRIDKPYHYFDCEEKDKESEKYSTIGYTKIYTTGIPWFIETKISEMAKEIKGAFSVLIISPYKKQTKFIVDALKEKGLRRIESTSTNDDTPSLIEAIKLLLIDRNDNLGWRIAVKHFLDTEAYIKLVIESDKHPEKKIYELIPKDVKAEIKKILSIVKSVLFSKPVNENEFAETLRKLGIDPLDLAKELLKDEIVMKINNADPAIKKIPIKATTIQSSKGLAADLVFITHFDKRYFIGDGGQLSDQDICNFIVSLTRAKKKAYLISSTGYPPDYFSWIKQERIEVIERK